MLPEVEKLRHLPVAKKLQVIEELWEDIEASGEQIPLPEWHRAEVERRAAELETDPSLALTRKEMWRRVEKRNG